MFKEFGIQNENIYKVAVVSTMSSGKSTFINAMLGKELLLSRNEACSARVISILDNDQNIEDRIYVKYNNGSFEKEQKLTQEYMEKINSDERIDKVLIETGIEGIKNTDRAMVIIDTPGINNSMDDSHRDKTMKLLRSMDQGLIVYLLNATQLGVEDDWLFLSEIVEMVNKSDHKLEIMFVINKIDELDDEKEDISKVIEDAHSYLIQAGAKNPQMYPVSSLACKLFRIGMNGGTFSRKETSDFENLYNAFAPHGFDPSRYIIADEYDLRNKKVTIGQKEYFCRDLYAAIDNTGMTHVENAIEDYMAESGEVYTPEINIQETIYSDGKDFTIEDGYIRTCPKNVTPYQSLYRDGISSACFSAQKCAQCSNQKNCCVVFKENNLAWVYIRPKLQISVLATMSSGKSTLINALLGTALLPSKNEACTATIARILGNDNMNSFSCVCRNIDEQVIGEKHENVTNADLTKFNEQGANMENDDPNKIFYLDLEGPISGIELSKMHLYLQDTPGPNNSRDLRYQEFIDDLIENRNNSVILYVMNATQLRVNDDYHLLKMISTAMQNGGQKVRNRFIFVINKFEEIDLEKEDANKTIQAARDYLKEFGFEQPNIIPISARAALLLRKEHNGEFLSRAEKGDLLTFKFNFADPDFESAHFEKKASLSPLVKKKLEDRLSKADEYETALIHTGVPGLEETINEYIKNFSFTQVKAERKVYSHDSDKPKKAERLGFLDGLIKSAKILTDMSFKIEEQAESPILQKASASKSYFVIQNHTIKSCEMGCKPIWNYSYERENRLVAKFRLDDCLYCPMNDKCGAQLMDAYSWVEIYEKGTMDSSVANQFDIAPNGCIGHCPRGCVPLQTYTDGRAAFDANTCRRCGNKDSCGIVLTGSDIVWVQVTKSSRHNTSNQTSTPKKLSLKYINGFTIEGFKILHCKMGCAPIKSEYQDDTIIGYFKSNDCSTCSAFLSNCPAKYGKNYMVVRLQG